MKRLGFAVAVTAGVVLIGMVWLFSKDRAARLESRISEWIADEGVPV